MQKLDTDDKRIKDIVQTHAQYICSLADTIQIASNLISMLTISGKQLSEFNQITVDDHRKTLSCSKQRMYDFYGFTSTRKQIDMRES